MPKLIVTLEMDVAELSDQELLDSGYDPEWEADEGPIVVQQYEPSEIVCQLSSVLMLDENRAELFAGTGVFANIAAVRVTASRWDD